MRVNSLVGGRHWLYFFLYGGVEQDGCEVVSYVWGSNGRSEDHRGLKVHKIPSRKPQAKGESSAFDWLKLPGQA